MFSGTSSAFRGTDGHPASLYYWEMTNLGGRKLSYGLVPNLLVLFPCWMKYDIVPENLQPKKGKRAKEGVRTLVTFAAKVSVAVEPVVSSSDPQTRLPVLRTPAEQG